MVNAAMTTQLALERFDVTGIVVSGIAGGVDPSLHVGGRRGGPALGQYLEAVFAARGRRQVPAAALGEEPRLPNYGMIFPAEVGVRSAKEPVRNGSGSRPIPACWPPRRRSAPSS
jgi:adenosylhomocysteine nucleosidase